MNIIDQCPICKNKLYKRYEGLVCKNWKCSLYHKHDNGWVKHIHITDWSLNRQIVNDISDRTDYYIKLKWGKKKQEILLRDDYCCKMCDYSLANDSLHTIGLQVHHIIPANQEMALYFDDDNLITLCANCHRKIHSDDKYTFHS